MSNVPIGGAEPSFTFFAWALGVSASHGVGSGLPSGDGADSLRVVLNSSSSPVSCAWVSGESMRVVLNSSSSSGPFGTLGLI